MSRLNLDNLDEPDIVLSGNDEITEIGKIYNDMAHSLHDAIDQLKTTTSAKEKIETELNTAREIQMSVIPNTFPAFPNIPEIEIYAEIHPANTVAGDLYDFFFIDDRHICFYIGDVSGKGIPASLFMVITRTILRSQIREKYPLDQSINRVNELLFASNKTSMFVTLFICILDINTGVLEYCNAGHGFACLSRNQQSIERLETVHGGPLGLFDDSDYTCEKVTLSPNDLILIYTDGISEATNKKNELYGDERLFEFIENNKTSSPESIIKRVLVDVRGFVKEAEQSDDIALLSLAYRGYIKNKEANKKPETDAPQTGEGCDCP